MLDSVHMELSVVNTLKSPTLSTVAVDPQLLATKCFYSMESIGSLFFSLLSSWAFWVWLIFLLWFCNHISNVVQSNTFLQCVFKYVFASVSAAVIALFIWTFICLSTCLLLMPFGIHFKEPPLGFTAFLVIWLICNFFFTMHLVGEIEGAAKDAMDEMSRQRRSEELAEERRRESVRCKECGADEAIIFVRKDVLSTRREFATVMRESKQMQQIPNPNFGRPDHIGIPDRNPTIWGESYSRFPVQIVVEYAQVRETWGCQYCKRQWSHDTTEMFEL